KEMTQGDLEPADQGGQVKPFPPGQRFAFDDHGSISPRDPIPSLSLAPGFSRQVETENRFNGFPQGAIPIRSVRPLFSTLPKSSASGDVLPASLCNHRLLHYPNARRKKHRSPAASQIFPAKGLVHLPSATNCL